MADIESNLSVPNIGMQSTVSTPNIEADFAINAAGTVWGTIRGSIENQEDLQAEFATKQDLITSENKLNADLVSDDDTVNQFVTAEEKEVWNSKQDAISDLSEIRSNAAYGESAYDTIQSYGNIVTHNVSEFATASQGALADSALQPNDNISELVNNAGYITKSVSDLTNYTTTTDLNTALGNKQDVISDLSQIRAGAAAGATALQAEEYGTIVINI